MFVKIKNEKDDINLEKLACVKTDGKTIFNFNKFKTLLDLASNIYKKKVYLKNAENEQTEMKILLNKLKNIIQEI